MPWNEITLALDDSLVALERRWREDAEQRVRDFRAMLVRLAYRLGAGDRLEAIRRANPQILDTWEAQDWERFFSQALVKPWGPADPTQAEHPSSHPKSSPSPAKGEPVASPRAAREISEVEVAESKPVAELVPPSPSTAAQPAQSISEAARLLRGMNWDALRPPSMYRDIARKGGVRWKRGLMMVFILARLGVPSRIEMAVILSHAWDKRLTTTRSWVRKAGGFMAEHGFLVEGLLQGRPALNSSLVVYRLTSEGRMLAQRFGWEPVENEWERVIRLHEGDRYPVHTLGILAAAMHARLRGLEVEVLPPVENATPPDLRIGELFVEVEMGQKEHTAKWRNNASVNGGRVALVAATPSRRQALVADIKALHLAGKATDLESLALPLDEITPKKPYWLEEW